MQRKLGFTGSGAGYNSTRHRIAEEQININHFNRPKGIPPENLPLTLDEVVTKVLIPHSPFHQCTLRKYVRKYDILPYQCSECTLPPWWNDRPLTLQLDHQDGDNRNHILTNLRWLCPNCHTQTKNFSAKNLKRTKPICLKCGIVISRGSKTGRCRKCCQEHPTKILWPSNEELAKLVWEISTVQIAKKLGMSDKAVEKRCRLYNISKPSRGYWVQVKSLQKNKNLQQP